MTEPGNALDVHQNIKAECDRLPIYREAAAFWRSFENKLTQVEKQISPAVGEMKAERLWLGSNAADALLNRLEAGLSSIKAWLPGVTVLAGKFDTLIGQLTLAKASIENPKQTLDDLVLLRTKLMNFFGEIRTELDNLAKAQKWAGPQAMNAQGPANKPGSGGPGGASTSPGGSGMKESTQDPGATQPGGEEPGAGQTGDATDQTGTDQFSAPDPGVDTGIDNFGSDPIGSPGFNPSVDDPFVPRPDPSLAGTPSATLTPPSLSPLSPSSSLPSTLTTGSPSITPGVSAVPLTPMGALPGAPARRGSSEVDGQPVRPGNGETSTRAGFYPGGVPPMYPPMGGGAGGGGVGSGEASYARGNTRRASARESQRAGLQPQLLGRAGARTEEEVEPLQPFSGGEVLDEELWQVPGAAPATPPEPEGRRRQW